MVIPFVIGSIDARMNHWRSKTVIPAQAGIQCRWPLLRR
jgi:hypothetical protein